MRTAIYARYSSVNQREASIEDQVRICKAHIERESWSLVGTYADHAISGATTLRPGYQKLLEDARAGSFDIVLAEGLDRLSRDQEDIAGLYKHLSFADIKLVTLSEGEISELHVGLKGTMNALYLKDLAQKTWRGLEGRVRQGRSGGGLCYGYEVVREVDERGESVFGGRKIDAEEAETVRRIFREFAAGKSPRSIAQQLNKEDIPGPRAGQWRDTTIRGHHTRGTGIIHNQLYVGRLIWNRQRFIKDPTTGKRIARRNPEAEWIVKEVPELRIIEDDLWNEVQSRLRAIRETPQVKKARATRFWEQRRPRHLLTGLVRCGACGSQYASVGRNYLACSAARHKGTCESRRGIPRETLERLVLDGLRGNLMEPELVEEFVRAFHDEVNKMNRQRETSSHMLQKEHGRVEQKLDALVEAIAGGLRNPTLQSKLDTLQARKEELARSLLEDTSPAPRFHPNLAALYKQKVEQLQDALQDPSIRQEALEILRELIERALPSQSRSPVQAKG